MKGRMGLMVVEEEWSDFKGRIFKNRPKNLIQMLEETVQRYPDRIGFISGKRKLTFREFDGAVGRVAAGLGKAGVSEGDRVLLLLGTDLDFPLCFFALQKLGAVAIPLNTRFKAAELLHQINDSESKALIVDEEYWPQVVPVSDELMTVEKIFFNGDEPPRGTTSFSTLLHEPTQTFQPSWPSEESDSVILYTSGTTEKPKGAILHHRGLIATVMQLTDFAGTREDDKIICCVPLFHVTGLVMGLLSSILNGIPCVYQRNFKIKDFLEIMSKERVTQIACVPNILWMMINHPDFHHYNFSSFRQAFLGGSAATEEMVKGIVAKLPHVEISVGWGLTEGHGTDSATPFEDTFRKINAVGKPYRLVDVKIMDEEGRELQSGEVGEIMLKGPNIMKGYWKNQEATRAAITTDGWLHTGDIGKVDEEGFLYILDRKKHMINRGGEKIYSLEVENVIMTYPGVLEVAVFAVPDPVMGEAVKAAVVFRQGESGTGEDIRSFCAQHLASYKVPKYVQLSDALPRNPAGKLIKEEIRSQHLTKDDSISTSTV